MRALRTRFAVQAWVVVGFTFLVYWHAIWAGMPRADQVAYLHQAGAYSSFADLLAHAPDWNRTHAAGDAALYRPILYGLLAIEYTAFGYQFVLWQLTAVALHAAVAVSLLRLFWKTSLRETFWALGLSCLFAGGFYGAELVLWHHLTGYILFCLLVLLSLNGLIAWLVQPLPWSGTLLWSIAAAAGAVFTYEVGVFQAITTGGVLVWTARMRPSSDARQTRRVYFLVGALFLALPVVYLLARSGPRASEGLSALTANNVWLSVRYACIQLWGWEWGWLLPTVLRINVNGRADLTVAYGWSTIQCVNYVAALLCGAALVRFAFVRKHRGGPLMWHLLGLAVFPLLGYSWLIAYGRFLPRGLESNTVYYAYIPALYTCVLIALAALDFGSTNGNATLREVRPRQYAATAGAVGLGVLVLLNATATYNLSKSFRYAFSAPREVTIDMVKAWLDGPGRASQAYFRVNQTCIDDPLPWFTPHFRRGIGWQGTPTTTDVLFPEKSYNLNKQWLGDASVEVTDLGC